jgi:DnaJ-class molecular chaperone
MRKTHGSREGFKKMNDLWPIWILGLFIIVILFLLVESKFRENRRDKRMEGELEEIRREISKLEDELGRMTEDYQRRAEPLEDRLHQLKQDEFRVMSEKAMGRAMRIEAYACPNCDGEGTVATRDSDQPRATCDFCKGAGIIRADRITGWED